MSDTELIKMEGAELEFKQPSKLLIQRWCSKQNSSQFRNVVDRTLLYIKKDDVKLVLSDTIDHGPVVKEDLDYALNSLRDYFSKGIIGFAFVNPDNIFSQILVERFVASSSDANVRIFKDIKEAEDWLLSLLDNIDN